MGTLAELEIRIVKRTDMMSIHNQFCTDIFKFCTDSFIAQFEILPDLADSTPDH